MWFQKLREWYNGWRTPTVAEDLRRLEEQDARLDLLRVEAKITESRKRREHKEKAKSAMMAAFRDIDPKLSYAIKCTLTYLEAE